MAGQGLLPIPAAATDQDPQTALGTAGLSAPTRDQGLHEVALAVPGAPVPSLPEAALASTRLQPCGPSVGFPHRTEHSSSSAGFRLSSTTGQSHPKSPCSAEDRPPFWGPCGCWERPALQGTGNTQQVGQPCRDTVTTPAAPFWSTAGHRPDGPQPQPLLQEFGALNEGFCKRHDLPLNLPASMPWSGPGVTRILNSMSQSRTRPKVPTAPGAACCGHVAGHTLTCGAKPPARNWGNWFSTLLFCE